MSYLKKIFAVLTITAAAFNFFNVEAFALADNSAVLSVEAFTVDGGFIMPPAEITADGKTSVAEMLNNSLGRSKINRGVGAGNALTSLAIENVDFLGVNSEIDYVLTEKNITAGNTTAVSGWLSAGDFTSQSRWIMIVNNKASSLTPDNYNPVAGDVVRISFSVFGNGADLALSKDNMPAASTEQPVFEAANRDELYKGMATYYSSGDNEIDVSILSAAENPDSVQSNIDEALFDIGAEYDEVDPPDFGDDSYDDVEAHEDDDDAEEGDSDFADVTAPQQTTPPPALSTPPPVTTPNTTNQVDKIPQAPSSPTGTNIAYTIPLAGAAAALIFLFRRKKK